MSQCCFFKGKLSRNADLSFETVNFAVLTPQIYLFIYLLRCSRCTYQQDEDIHTGEEVLVDFMADGAVHFVLLRHGEHHHAPLTLTLRHL